MIIDIVTFIVTPGAQIVEFVNAVLDAVIAIADGGAGGVPALIEKRPRHEHPGPDRRPGRAPRASAASPTRSSRSSSRWPSR